MARGGGSAEDLASFNNEALARTIAASEIPVISAVGHETDFTITDFVADLRAPTPSAAAELVIRSRQEIEEQTSGLHERLNRAMRYRLLMGRQALTELAQHGAFARIMEVIRQRQQRLDDLSHRMELAERNLLQQMHRRWETVSAAVRHYDLRLVLSGVRKELDSKTVGAGRGDPERAAAAQGAHRAPAILRCSRFLRWLFLIAATRWFSMRRASWSRILAQSRSGMKSRRALRVGRFRRR